MTSQQSTLVLPEMIVTELAAEKEADAMLVRLPEIEQLGGVSYSVKPRVVFGEFSHEIGNVDPIPLRLRLFPVILCSDGSPWAEANLWILRQREGNAHHALSTFRSVAEDLAAFLRFVEERQIDWFDFPSQKFSRPTYRFNGYLKLQIQNQEIAASTAKRRMGTVVRFYRWLIEQEGVCAPKYPAWVDSDRYVEFSGRYGASMYKAVKTTDVSIRTPAQDDPYDGCIDDGGKLRPLTQTEQEWLLEALIDLGNTEMTLIHLFGLVTGARMQTILTFRIRDVEKDREGNHGSVLRYPIGPGTGIDTKNNKKLVLHIPMWFYRMLRTYAFSERAKRRRAKSVGGDSPQQYLFLSVRGAPLYSAKDQRAYPVSVVIRHEKVGQGVRQYIVDYIIPLVRKRYDKKFHYRFHDTRATFGMNLVDDRLRLVEEKKESLSNVLSFVQARMGHASPSTTERYLNFRSRQAMVHAIQDGWESRLERLAMRAIESANE